MQVLHIETSKLVPNTGQIEGLPKNPRFIRDEKYSALVRSIQDDPEMLELRELIVYPLRGKYVVIAGNMRLRAIKEIGHEKAPCKVLDEVTPLQKLKAFAVKDNVPFGEHDWDALANEWDAGELADWGLDVPGFVISPDELTDSFSLPEGDREPFQQITFTLADEQATMIKNAIDDIKKTDEYKYAETFGNENSNGNALYLIVLAWAGQRI